MITVEGKHGIKATVLADSINEQGVRMLTFEIEYPRIVLAELNTHRMLSKNSFSSRAVPFTKMVQQLNGRPVRFGANQAGMQDKGEDYEARINIGYDQLKEEPIEVGPDEAWEFAKQRAVWAASGFHAAGYHKQVYNRLMEPWQMMKTVISGTEWANFFWLRDHGAADPTLAELARVMREAKDASKPVLLKAGQWHLPYVNMVMHSDDGDDGAQHFYIDEHFEEVGASKTKVNSYLTLEEAIKISCARCAAISYRNEGYDLAKSLEVYDRLVGDDRKHASAFEHQATPMKDYEYTWGEPNATTKTHVNNPQFAYTWEQGITHADRKGRLWSGNLRGWIQYRKLIKGENYEGEES